MRIRYMTVWSLDSLRRLRWLMPGHRLLIGAPKVTGTKTPTIQAHRMCLLTIQLLLVAVCLFPRPLRAKRRGDQLFCSRMTLGLLTRQAVSPIPPCRGRSQCRILDRARSLRSAWERTPWKGASSNIAVPWLSSKRDYLLSQIRCLLSNSTSNSWCR